MIEGMPSDIPPLEGTRVDKELLLAMIEDDPKRAIDVIGSFNFILNGTIYLKSVYSWAKLAHPNVLAALRLREIDVKRLNLHTPPHPWYVDALYTAAEQGHLQSLKLMLEKSEIFSEAARMPPTYPCSLNIARFIGFSTLLSGTYRLVSLLIDSGTTSPWNLDVLQKITILFSALTAFEGHMEPFLLSDMLTRYCVGEKQFQEMLSEKEKAERSNLLLDRALKGSPILLRYLLSIPEVRQTAVVRANELIDEAIKRDNAEMMTYLLTVSSLRKHIDLTKERTKSLFSMARRIGARHHVLRGNNIFPTDLGGLILSYLDEADIVSADAQTMEPSSKEQLERLKYFLLHYSDKGPSEKSMSALSLPQRAPILMLSSTSPEKPVASLLPRSSQVERKHSLKRARLIQPQQEVQVSVPFKKSRVMTRSQSKAIFFSSSSISQRTRSKTRGKVAGKKLCIAPRYGR